MFPTAKLLNLVAPVSDHSPIMVDTMPTSLARKHRPFRFENKWLEEPDLRGIIDISWVGFRDLYVLNRLQATTETLGLWGKHIATDFRMNKEEVEHRITLLQDRTDSGSAQALRDAKKELARLLINEETHWQQCAKVY